MPLTISRMHCLAASAAAHALALALIKLAPELARRAPPEPPFHPLELTSIPDSVRLTDDGSSGGGGRPAARPRPPSNPPPERHEDPPPPPATHHHAPDPEPPKAVTEHNRSKPADDVKPPKADHPKPPRSLDRPPAHEDATTGTESTKHVVRISSTKVETGPVEDPRAVERQKREAADAERRERAHREAVEQYRKELRDGLRAAANGVEHNTGATMSIEMPGNTGGEAFADYRFYLAGLYRRQWEQNRPGAISADSAVAQVRLTVGRDGVVRKYEIYQPSGIKSVDASVERLLSRNKTLRPFPAGATDDERVFNLSFRVEADSPQ